MTITPLLWYLIQRKGGYYGNWNNLNRESEPLYSSAKMHTLLITRPTKSITQCN